MPTAIHECFTASVVNAFDRAIDDLVERLRLRGGNGHLAIIKAVERIFKGGSTTVALDKDRSNLLRSDLDGEHNNSPIRRSPDASYYHQDAAAYPQLVIETSYSQQRHQLDRLAESYIVDSRHTIRCVLGLDIPYIARSWGRASKSLRSVRSGNTAATISLWRPMVVFDAKGESVGVCVCNHDALPFRNSDHTPCEGHLSLLLSDLLPQATLDTLPDDAKYERIRVPLADLAEALNAAEQCQATIVAEPARSSPTSTPTKFRKRRRSPSPALSLSRESTYEECELAQQKKCHRADRAWRSPSSNRTIWIDAKRRRSPRNKMKIKFEHEDG